MFKRYRGWVKADVFKRFFDTSSEDPGLAYAMVDATIVKVHRHGQGAEGDFAPSHRPLKRLYDNQDLGFDGCIGVLDTL